LGDELPTKDSITLDNETLQENIDFVSISYKNEIKKWIQSCIKAVYNKPLIRETLIQYEYLINELTNQSNNIKMTEEIINLITQDLDKFEVYQDLINQQNNIYTHLINKLKNELEDVHNVILFNLSNKKYTGFCISNTELIKLNIKIHFEFEQNNYRDFYFGFSYMDETNKLYNAIKFQEIFKLEFNEILSTESWPAYAPFHKYRFWNNNLKQNFGDILDGNMKNEILLTIDRLLKVIEEYNRSI
jgi:hypothetical protein